MADFSVKGLAQSLGEFKKQNRDCNYKSMSREIMGFLQEIISADGRIDEREELAVEKVRSVFDEVDRFNFKQAAKSGLDSVVGVASKIPVPHLKGRNKPAD